MPKITVHAPDLLRALRLVKHAAAALEEGRPIIATILFEGDADGFRLVAADNYRIGIAKLDVEGDRETFGRGPLPLRETPGGRGGPGGGGGSPPPRSPSPPRA